MRKVNLKAEVKHLEEAMGKRRVRIRELRAENARLTKELELWKDRAITAVDSMSRLPDDAWKMIMDKRHFGHVFYHELKCIDCVPTRRKRIRELAKIVRATGKPTMVP